MAQIPTQTYKLIRSDDPEKLIVKVNELLADGWMVQGGVAIHMIGSAPMFYQSIVNTKHTWFPG